jgi:hypothetical protein
MKNNERLYDAGLDDMAMLASERVPGGDAKLYLRNLNPSANGRFGKPSIAAISSRRMPGGGN